MKGDLRSGAGNRAANENSGVLIEAEGFDKDSLIQSYIDKILCGGGGMLLGGFKSFMNLWSEFKGGLSFCLEIKGAIVHHTVKHL